MGDRAPRETNWSVQSHGHEIHLERDDAGGLIWFASSNGVTISEQARLNLTTVDGADLLSGLMFAGTETVRIDESYEMVVGKRVGTHRVDHVQRTVHFTASGRHEVSVVLRAAHDGVALRVVLRGVEGLRLIGGDVQLRFPRDTWAWPLTYTPWYETPRFAATLDQLEPGDYGFPFLARIDESTFVLVTESDLDGRYGGSFARYEGSGAFTVTLADDVLIETSEVATPWRVLLIGDLADVVESHLVDDLAPASSGRPPAWVRPGRAAWSWWSDFYSGAHLDKQLRMLHYAAERGWEYVLVDCGWDSSWMPELVAAASRHGIGVFVWVAWDQLYTPVQRQALAVWASWGVAGVKIDFMESESQERYRWYDAVIAECERVGLMINFHGSVIPRGWARTHPHVVSYEAVRGAEYYAFYGEPLSAEHNTIVPFTRNVVGSADYTPVTFSAPGRDTTEAHELALAVVLESGVQHFADEVDEYAKRPIAEQMLERIPAHWDETRLLAGSPGRYAALARRRGDEWFIGVISAQEPMTMDVDLTRLDLGDSTYSAAIVSDDGACLDRTTRMVHGTEHVSLALERHGGALVALIPAARPMSQKPDTTGRPTVELARSLITAHPGQTVTVTATIGGSGARLVVPPGWPPPQAVRSEHLGDGGIGHRMAHSWHVSIPDDVTAGHVAVLAVHAGEPLTAQRSVVDHVRIVTPLAGGETSLVQLRPIATTNGHGPVEIDSSNGGGDPGDGRAMTIAGRTYPTGLGVCAPSEIAFALAEPTGEFSVVVGVDDESAPDVGAVCQVIGDENVLAEQAVAAGEQAVTVRVDVTGVTRLRLVVLEPSLGREPAHVDWIAPAVRTPPEPERHQPVSRTRGRS